MNSPNLHRKKLPHLSQIQKEHGNPVLSKMTRGHGAAREVYVYGGLDETDFCEIGRLFGQLRFEYSLAISGTTFGNQKCNGYS